MFLQENLEKMRILIRDLRPDTCCEPQPMTEVGKGTSVVCSNDCKWQELEGLLAVAMVDADLLSK